MKRLQVLLLVSLASVLLFSGCGKKEEEAPFRGEHTQVLEYGKETLIVPGLHDNHIHLMPAGMLAKYLNIFDMLPCKLCMSEEITTNSFCVLNSSSFLNHQFNSGTVSKSIMFFLIILVIHLKY